MNLKPLVLLVAAALAPALLAQETTTPKREAQVEARANRQQKRIAQGVASGQLTPKETQNLEKREAKINKDIAKAEAGMAEMSEKFIKDGAEIYQNVKPAAE